MNFIEKLSTDQLNLLSNTVNSHTSPTVVRRVHSILLLHEKSSSEDIFKATGYWEKNAIRFAKSFMQEGLSALVSLKSKKRKSAFLTSNEKEELIMTINTKKPSDIWPGEDSSWTTDLVAEFMFEKFNIECSSKDSSSISIEESSFSFRKR